MQCGQRTNIKCRVKPEATRSTEIIMNNATIVLLFINNSTPNSDSEPRIISNAERNAILIGDGFFIHIPPVDRAKQPISSVKAL